MTFAWDYIASLFPILARFGTAALIIGGAGAIAIWFPPLRKPAIAVVVGFIILSIAYSVGLKDGVAQQKAVNDARQGQLDRKVDDAVTGAVSDAATDGVRDPFDNDKY